MKFVYSADWHLSGYSQDKVINRLPERLYEKKIVQENIGNYCIENNIKTVMLGVIYYTIRILFTQLHNL